MMGIIGLKVTGKMMSSLPRLQIIMLRFLCGMDIPNQAKNKPFLFHCYQKRLRLFRHIQHKDNKMKTFTILKNGSLMNTVSAKDITSAVRLAGIFTEDGSYEQHPGYEPSFSEVKHNNLYEVIETKIPVSEDPNGVLPILISFDHKSDVTIAQEYVNKSLLSTVNLLF